jgi:hypothetical protein
MTAALTVEWRARVERELVGVAENRRAGRQVEGGRWALTKLEGFPEPIRLAVGPGVVLVGRRGVPGRAASAWPETSPEGDLIHMSRDGSRERSLDAAHGHWRRAALMARASWRRRVRSDTCPAGGRRSGAGCGRLLRPVPGARFEGRNRSGGFEWTTTCVVTQPDRPSALEWVVLDSARDPQRPGAIWRHDLVPGSAGQTKDRRRAARGRLAAAGRALRLDCGRHALARAPGIWRSHANCLTGKPGWADADPHASGTDAASENGAARVSKRGLFPRWHVTAES